MTFFFFFAQVVTKFKKMSHRVFVTFFVFLVAQLVVSIECLKLSRPRHDEPITAFLCADNGTFSGMSELALVAETVFQKEPLNVAFCQSAFFGYTYGSGGSIIGVVLATTGIGGVNAASCTQSLILTSGLTFSKMIFVGTSGWSPVVGGFMPSAPGGCEELNAPVTIPVGSVCIAAGALDMSCGMCISNPVEAAGNLPNECSRPNCQGHLDQSMYGPCTQRGSKALATALMSANAGIPLPMPPAAVLQGTAEWWASNEAVSPATRRAPRTAPIITDACVEADAHQIWVGAPLDYLCREYSAEFLGSSSQQLPCVVAMESAGFLSAVNGYLASSPTSVIDAVVVRAASNWDMYPMAAAGPGNLNTTLRWAQNTTYTSETNHLAFVKAGYQYAVNTSNQVLLKYIKKYL